MSVAKPQMDYNDTYPVTSDSIARSIEATRQERLDNGLDPETGKPISLDPRDPPCVLSFPIRHEPTDQERHASMLALSDMVEAFGEPLVYRWLRNTAAIRGKSLSRYLETDANGLPVGHAEGLHAAAKELTDVVNELPESFYHLGPTDAEWMTERVITRYLVTLTKTQRGAVHPQQDNGE